MHERSAQVMHPGRLPLQSRSMADLVVNLTPALSYEEREQR
jgi:hypothetical protein